MSLLVETIKTENGFLQNLTYHNMRMMRTISELFGKNTEIDLNKIVNVPTSLINGIYKCRVIYSQNELSYEFTPYVIRKVVSLKTVHDNEISYSYKYVNREKLNRLFELRGKCDDILIIKNGRVTDTSYANIVFRNNSGKWITPVSCLLPGTRRASLLKQGVIAEEEIGIKDLSKYSEARLINSMIGLEDTEGISVKNIEITSLNRTIPLHR
jgi:4-amino-4-deoxychorismate lyase